MKIEWTQHGRRAFDDLIPDLKHQVLKAVDKLQSTPPGVLCLDLKRCKQMGTAGFTFRISREVRGILERTQGGYFLVDIVRRGDKRYYSTE